MPTQRNNRHEAARVSPGSLRLGSDEGIGKAVTRLLVPRGTPWNPINKYTHGQWDTVREHHVKYQCTMYDFSLVPDSLMPLYSDVVGHG